MIGIKRATGALRDFPGHILVTGRAGTGKSQLVKNRAIRDARYFDFTELCINYHRLREENVAVFLNEILSAEEKTVILDGVDFDPDSDPQMTEFFKTARKKGKRIIATTYPWHPGKDEKVSELFGCVITTQRELDRFSCTVQISRTFRDVWREV